MAIGCGENGSSDAAASDVETTEQAIGGDGPNYRRLKWEGEFAVRGIDHPFAAYMLLGQDKSAISGLLSRFDANFIDWLENRYDISFSGGVDRDKLFVRVTLTSDQPRLVYVLDLAGTAMRGNKSPRVDKIDVLATLRIYFRERLLKEKNAHLVADRIQDSKRDDARIGDAISACTEICRCEDKGSVPACTAICLSAKGFGSIPTCVTCVNNTLGCPGVKACLGAPACQ